MNANESQIITYNVKAFFIFFIVLKCSVLPLRIIYNNTRLIAVLVLFISISFQAGMKPALFFCLKFLFFRFSILKVKTQERERNDNMSVEERKKAEEEKREERNECENGLTYDYSRCDCELVEPLYLRAVIKASGKHYDQLADELKISKAWLRELIRGRGSEDKMWPYDLCINTAIALNMTTRQMFFTWDIDY